MTRTALFPPLSSTGRAVLALGLLVLASALGGCAQRGARSPDAQPVLYPNAAYKRMGEARAQDELQACMAAARQAGLSPEEKDNAVGRGAAKGAAVGGTAAAVGSLVRGQGVDSAVSAGAKGAAVGGAAGAVAGAFHERPNMTYRHFVQRCAREQGLEVIGWQ
ncbi:MAG: glycine zipper family protein [Hylemonella sp.]